MDPLESQLPRSRVALQSLERALARLEGVVARGHHGDLFLAQQLQAMKADYARLDETSRAVEERLDATIGRLRSLLEEED
ncbi:hypothetical protein GALL_253030 [mine drainage metagenome]|uniref:Uncharacterized protein n=1 Tax=mine drainage metagenome TaxID=410659 RepID=A0A1J5R9R1_9ZZZZ